MNLNKRAEAERFLSAPPREVRACVIYGKDRGGVRERALNLARKLVRDPDDPFDVALLGEGDIDSDPARLADELSALSLMGGRRLVRLQIGGERAAPDRIAAEALRAHVEGAYNPDAFLLVEAGALDRNSGLRKAAESLKEAACIPVYEDEIGDLARFTRETLSREGVGLTTEALDAFVNRLPRERGVARQEIERLVLFLGPGSGTVADAAMLQDHLGAEPEASLFDAAEHAFGARAPAAYTALRRAMDQGEAGVMAVRAAGLHLAKLRKASVRLGEGAQPAEAAKAAGVFWKSEREFLRQLRAWTGQALDEVQAEIADADRACKTAGSPDALIAERLYLVTAAKARRLGL
jgi:DNA polymerase-3 subunit delta